MTEFTAKVLLRLETITLLALVYFATYSTLEAFQSDIYMEWTAYCSELAHTIVDGFPGVARMSGEIVELGYASRVPYFEHMSAAIVMFIGTIPFVSLLNSKYIYLTSKDKIKRAVLISRYLGVQTLFLPGIFVYLYLGIEPKTHPFRSYQPHISNFDVFLYSSALVFLVNMSFYWSVSGILRLHRYLRSTGFFG
ncbi:hypothetical protein [Sneathiella limimaris]|uniref:hypothetical protein n=1 Tax=Sneathiella limimaris TaxID=1964213 RepID=UPI00146E0EE7|nr:hypothetical protein [Sneathiella limimaris]